MATTRLMTADELLTLPDDGSRYELIQGVPDRMAPGRLEHGSVGRRIATRMGAFADDRGLGEVFGPDTGFIIRRDPDTILVPDVSFVRTDRLPPPAAWSGYGDVVPDLVVEVVSPHDRMPDIAAKIAVYLDAGVPIVWSVHPLSRSARVHRAGRETIVVGPGDVLDGGEVLPGFRLPAGDIFR